MQRVGGQDRFITHKWSSLSTLLLFQSNHKPGTGGLRPVRAQVPKLGEGVEWREEPSFWTKTMLKLSTALITNQLCDLSLLAEF